MSSIRKLYESTPPPYEGPGANVQHNQHCVCHGTGMITIDTHGTTGLNGSTPIRGYKKVPCPYGYLRINQRNEITPSASDDEGWDL